MSSFLFKTIYNAIRVASTMVFVISADRRDNMTAVFPPGFDLLSPIDFG
jgi:hypothetical protein